MRFRRLHAVVFGRLRDRDFDLRDDAILVVGGNEAGKTTFRSALETILYGFEPATRDAHPLHRWDEAAGDLLLEAELELAGGVQRVERLLQSTGRSRLAEGDRPFEGARRGNAPLPFLAGLPRGLYQSVYSLELAQLEALHRGEQDRIDALLLPEPEALHLLPASVVRRGLRAERRTLWRSDRRGKPRAAALRQQLGEARRAVDAAAHAEQALRSARAEQDALAAELSQWRARKRELESVGADADYLRQVCELERRRRRLGLPPDLSALGDLPLEDPRELDAEIDELERELSEPRARLARPEECCEPDVVRVLAAGNEIEASLAAAALHESEGARVAELGERARRARDAALRELSRVREGQIGAAELEAARRVDLGALRDAHRDWSRGWDEHEAQPPARPRPPLWTLGVASVGVAGFALASAGVLAGELALPAGLVAFAALVAALLLRARPAGDPPPRLPDAAAAPLAALAVRRRMPMRPDELEHIIEALARIRAHCNEVREAEAEAASTRTDLAERERAWQELSRRLELADADAGEPPAKLRDSLRRAREREAAVARDRGERDEAARWVERLAPRLARKRDHGERLRAALQSAEPDFGAPELAYARVLEQQRERQLLREREVDLQADPRWSQAKRDPRILAESETGDAPWLPDVALRRERELASLDDRIRRADTRAGELSALIGGGDADARARAEDRVAEIGAELEATRRRHDQLALLESILGRAERDFREAHQPDVLRRASAYLNRLTSGRYARLDYLDGPDGGLYATCEGTEEPVAVAHPISRGTLDQIHLCLRLGLLDHLDEGRERLPLVLDDALVRSDDERRPEIYRLLAELSPARQIFFLTCHRGIAAEAESALKARRIDLLPED